MLNDKKKIACVLYAFAFLIFAVECVCSLWGISPFWRIGLVSLTGASLYAGSRMRISGADKESEEKVMRVTFWILFILFIMLFFALVFVDSYFKDDVRAGAVSGDVSFSQYKENYLSLVPFESTSGLLYSLFRGWISYKRPLVNIGGNLLLCMPFAFFLPLCFKKQHKFLPFLLTVAGISAFVECAQLVTMRGFCDIDDVIFNVGGACIAFGILHLKSVRKIINKITRLEY